MLADPASDYGRSFSPATLRVGHRLAFDALTAELIRDLQAAGVSPILLKGPSIGQWLYPEGGRTYADIDLLIGLEDLHRCETVLEANGYGYGERRESRHRLDGEPSVMPQMARCWWPNDDRPQVELHLGLVGLRASREETWNVLSTRTVAGWVAGREVLFLDPAARALHVTLHAYGHGPGVAKPQEDLRRAVDMAPFASWQEARALAVRLQGVDAMAAGLRATPEGSLLADRLQLPHDESTEVYLTRIGAPSSAFFVNWLSRQGSTRSVARLLWRKAFPSRTALDQWFRDKDLGTRWLPVAYVVYLTHLFVAGPRGLFTWSRTRRRVDRSV